MAKFNPNKIEAFRDFLDLQTSLKNAQKSYDDAKRVEQVTDAIMTMGIEAGAAAQKHYIKSRNRKLLLVGMVLAGGAYLYNKTKTKKENSQERPYKDYSGQSYNPKSSRKTNKEASSYAK